MAIQSWGYPGTIAPGSVWANMQKGLGRRYWVESGAAVRCTTVASGTREVQLSVGYFGGWGILDYNNATATVQLPTVASGTRYFLVVARRTWGTTNTTTFATIDAGTTPVIPSRNTTPGTLDDQPLWLVPLTAGQTVPGTPVDVRAVGAGDGPFRAGSDLVRQYMDFEGVQLSIGSYVWTREPDGAGNPIWVRTQTGSTATKLLTGQTVNPETGWAVDNALTAQCLTLGNMVQYDVELRRGSTSSAITFGADGGLVDTQIATLLGPKPDRIIKADYEIFGGATASSAGSYRCFGKLDTAGILWITSGPPNVTIRQSTTAMSLRTNILFMKETV